VKTKIINEFAKPSGNKLLKLSLSEHHSAILNEELRMCRWTQILKHSAVKNWTDRTSTNKCYIWDYKNE